jgi:hypothetical protein
MMYKAFDATTASREGGLPTPTTPLGEVANAIGVFRELSSLAEEMGKVELARKAEVGPDYHDLPLPLEVNYTVMITWDCFH